MIPLNIENFWLNKIIFNYLFSFSHIHNIIDISLIFISKYLIWLLILFFTYFFLSLSLKDKIITFKEMVQYSIGIIFSYFITWGLKTILLVPRPFINENILPIIDKSQDLYNSFPSGHTTLAFALSTNIFLYNKKIGYFAFIVAGLISISRIIVGVHYPLDIIMGIIIGITFPIILYKIIHNDK